MSPDRIARFGYLALGDSYSIGEGVQEIDRWPNQLAFALRARGIGIEDPLIIATTGWTTDELGVAIDGARLTNDYALVSLLIGVNNQYRGLTIANFAHEFSDLLERAIVFATGDHRRVIVVSTPDWGVSAFAAGSGRDVAMIAMEIDAFNTTARSLAESRGVSVVDITDLTRAYPEEVVEDGLHPNAVQYARWVERILPVAAKALSGASLY